MAEERMYTADQVALAARELRQAAGTEPESFSAAQVVSMLRDEVRLLRERGFTDERIAGMFSSFDIAITGDELTRYSEQEPSFG